MATPAAEQLEQVLNNRFPGIRFGRYNCRKISGSSTYSQHSWNNARDIYPPEELDFTEDEAMYTSYLDEVWAFIQENHEDLNIDHDLWLQPGHYNHIHVDFHPQGHKVPPCDNGALQYEYPDGTITIGLPASLINEYVAPVPEPEETDINLHALVDAAFDARPDTVKGSREYWHGLADTNPTSDEWYDLFYGMLGGELRT